MSENIIQKSIFQNMSKFFMWFSLLHGIKTSRIDKVMSVLVYGRWVKRSSLRVSPWLEGAKDCCCVSGVVNSIGSPVTTAIPHPGTPQVS